MDGYEEAHRTLYELLRAGAGLTPQVAGRRINTFYRAVVQRVARKLWEAGSSASSEAEREHLRYTAQWLGYRPDEGQ
jgi:hypothetical protein